MTKLGKKKVDRTMDLVNFVRQSRALNVLMRLILSKKEQRLVQRQRKESVLELSSDESPGKRTFKDDDEVIDEKWVSAYLSKVKDGANEDDSNLSKLQRGVLYRDWDQKERLEEPIIDSDTVKIARSNF